MTYLFIVLLGVFTGVGHTSKEGILIFDSFQVESKGIGSSGPVSVIAKKGKSRFFDSILIRAFGREFLVEEKILKKIPKTANGIQMTYEKGYEELGGKTLYLSFSKGFTSSQKQKKVLAVKEFGEISFLE